MQSPENGAEAKPQEFKVVTAGDSKNYWKFKLEEGGVIVSVYLDKEKFNKEDDVTIVVRKK